MHERAELGEVYLPVAVLVDSDLVDQLLPYLGRLVTAVLVKDGLDFVGVDGPGFVLENEV